MQTTLDYMGIMLDSTKLADKSFTINLQVTNDQNYLLKVHHGVLLYYPDEQMKTQTLQLLQRKPVFLQSQPAMKMESAN